MRVNVSNEFLNELPTLCQHYDVNYENYDAGEAVVALIQKMDRELAACYRQIAIDKSAITDLRQELTVASVKSLVG